MADAVAAAFADSPGFRDVAPPQRLDLPTGPAYVIRGTGVAYTGDQAPVSAFLLGERDLVVMVTCSNGVDRTDDLWLSIVETLEVLPEEE